MRLSVSTFLTVICLFAAAPASLAQTANLTPFQQRVLVAMQGEMRTPEERARDVNRLPTEILEFFRMREDMRVIEILPADRATVNQSTFEALKSGGYYGIVDHTRRHNQPATRENGRRVDPVLVIKEVQAAGFVLVDFSALYYRPNDALALEVANPEVNDRTDRIALLFRKP
jgi:predicted methyltransferase